MELQVWLIKTDIMWAGRLVLQRVMEIKKRINTFISIFPTNKPNYALFVMLENPKINKDLIYNYRGIDTKAPYNTSGWNSVYVAGKIIEKIGPILAINNNEFIGQHVVEKFN